MKRIVVTSSVCFAFFVLACSSSDTKPTQPSGSGGSSASTTSSKGGQTSSTTSSSGPVGGSSATSTTQGSGGSTATSGNTAAGGSTATSGNTAAGGSTASGTTGAKGGATGTSSGATGAKGGSTGAGGSTGSSTSSSAGGKTSTGAGGTDAQGGSGNNAGAGPKGGSSPGGSSSTSGGAGPGGVAVQLDATKQTIVGFGINATIMPSGKSLPWQQLFTTDGDKGIGLSILRIGMNENGGHRDVPTDWQQARTLGAKIIGSCWTAPAAWKDNNNTKGGGHLLPDRYKDWATRIAEYAKTNDLYAMSIGNETDFASCSPSQNRPCNPPLTDEYESMVYTGKELAAFVKTAGPIFKDKAPNTKMMAPEASLWIHVWSNLSPTNKANGGYDSSDPLGCKCFSNDLNDTAALAKCDTKCTTGEAGYDYGHWLAKDQQAWDAFDILGVHQYESQIGYAWPADVTGGKRTKEVWQTEMSGVMYWPEQGPSTNIANGVAVAGWIHSALTVGEVSAWLYWWYEAYYQDDNEGLALTKGGTTIAKRYYAMGNYSKFIRPDYVMVDVAGNTNTNVLLSAAKSADGKTVVIVAINKGTSAATVPIGFAGGTAPASCTPTVTSANDNLKDGAAVTVTDGKLSASLAGQTVTTFVCK